MLGHRVGGEREAAGHLAQHDAAVALGVVLAQPRERLDDLALGHLARVGEVGGGERVGRQEQQRLDDPGELVHAPDRHVIGRERRVLLPLRLARLVELEQGEQGHRLGHAVGALHGVVEQELAAPREQRAQVREPLLDRHVRARHVAEVERRRRAQEAADAPRRAARARTTDVGDLERDPAQLGRQRRGRGSGSRTRRPSVSRRKPAALR